MPQRTVFKHLKQETAHLTYGLNQKLNSNPTQKPVRVKNKITCEKKIHSSGWWHDFLPRPQNDRKQTPDHLLI